VDKARNISKIGAIEAPSRADIKRGMTIHSLFSDMALNTGLF